MLKDFFADSRTAFGSLLTACILISGCSYNNSYYATIKTSPAMIGAVPSEDRDKHERCVYFALDVLEPGERCDWYSENGSTMGQAQVVAYRPSGSGFCATVFSAVYHKNKWANWQDLACTTAYSNQWEFISQ